MTTPAAEQYLGLAPFLRLSIAGEDLRPIAGALLELAGQQPDNAPLWLNLATASFALGQREHGLQIQDAALSLQRTYRLAALRQPARRQLLVLAVAGDIAENTPIDCLLDGSDIDLIWHFATPAQPAPQPLPQHDAVLVAIADSAANRPLLAQLATLLADWPRPVLNAPAAIPHTERSAASTLLGDIPGVLMPPTRPVSRAALQRLAEQPGDLPGLLPGGSFPIIVRPVGSQAGRDLVRIEQASELAAYLEQVADADFYLSRFIDYSGHDGLFRKFRIALIDGRPYICHMAVSQHWMVHYVNAGMYENAERRAEEAAFMAGFASFAARHIAALSDISRRIGLDYFCIDCAETRAGELLIFEVDHVMVVHAMDDPALFPYKQEAMGEVCAAFIDLLDRRCAAAAGETP